MKKCTCCGKDIDEMGIELQLHAKAFRITNNDTEEGIPNVDTENRELLCYSCFTRFCEAFSSFEDSKFPGPEDPKTSNVKE